MIRTVFQFPDFSGQNVYANFLPYLSCGLRCFSSLNCELFKGWGLVGEFCPEKSLNWKTTLINNSNTVRTYQVIQKY